MALVSGTRSSTLNPNAPLFIPCYMRQVEDFSPEWWNLVTSSTWFREHWLSENQVEDDNSFFDGDDIIDLLPDSIDFDIGVDEETLNMEAQYEEFLMSAQPVKTNQVNSWGKDAGAIVKSLSFNRERGVRSVIEPARHYEKPAKFVSGKCSPRPIQQPR